MRRLVRYTLLGFVLIVLLLIIGALVYGAWHVIRTYGIHLLFWGYIGISIILAVIWSMILPFRFGLYTAHRSDRLPLIAVRVQLARSGHVGRIRRIVIFSLYMLALAIGWPALMIQQWRRLRRHGDSPTIHSIVGQTALNGIDPPDMYLSTYMFLAAGGLFVTSGIAGVHMGYWHAASVLLVIAVSCIMLAYLLSPVSLATRLRRSDRKPYACLIFLLVVYFAALAMAGSIVLAGGSSALDLSHLEATVRTIFGFQVLKIIDDGVPEFQDAIVMVSGLVYYCGIVTWVFKGKEFQRNDDDFSVIAIQHAALGRFAESQEWVRKINDNGRQSARFSKTIACLGTNNLGDGIATAEQAAADHPDGNLSSTQIIVPLCITFPFPRYVLLSVVRELIDRRVDHVEIGLYVHELIQAKRIDANGLDRILNAHDMDKQQVLSRVVVLMMDEQWDQAIASLAPMTNGRPGEQIIAAVIRGSAELQALVEAPEDICEYLNSWCEEYAVQMQELVAEVTGVNETIACMAMLSEMATIAQLSNSERAEELDNYVRQLRDNALGQGADEIVLDAVLGARQAMMRKMRGMHM